MNTTTQHTPIPWTNYGLTIATPAKWDNGNKTEIEIATVHYEDNPIRDAQEDDPPQYVQDYDLALDNAQFIVRACNCHDNLLAACNAALERLEASQPPANGATETVCKQLKAAIAKATERI